MKKLHFKFFKYIFSRPYPFNHWLTLLTTYSKLWIYSFLYSLIFGLIFQISFINYLKFYFVINFFFMIFIVLSSYKLKDFFLLIYDTIEQLFRMIIGRLFGLRPIDYNYKLVDHRKYYGKNILDLDESGANDNENVNSNCANLFLSKNIVLHVTDREVQKPTFSK